MKSCTMNRWVRTCAVLTVLLAALTAGASAMHIAEGYLPVEIGRAHV